MSFGSLLGYGLRSATSAPFLVLGLVAAKGVWALARFVPLLLFIAFLQELLGQVGLGAALFGPSLDLRGYALAGAGATLAALLLGGLLELFVWSGGVRLLSADLEGGPAEPKIRLYLRSLSAGFPRFLALAAVMFSFRIGWFLFCSFLGVASTLVIAAEHAAPAIHLLGAVGVGASIALWLAGSIVTPMVAQLAMARVGALGEGALISIHQAVGQLIRRPLAPYGITLVLGALSLWVIAALATPLSAAASMGPGLALLFWGAAELIGVLVGSFTAIARMGAFVAVVSDDRRLERLKDLAPLTS